MKILFLIGSNHIYAVKTWDEIKKFKDSGHLTPSKDYYSIFKTMEQNIEFVHEILTARHNVGLPDAGISWDDYYKNYYLKSIATYDEKESQKFQDFFSKLNSEAKRIVKDKKPHDYIAEQIENLIIGGFVAPKDIPITFEAIQVDEQDPSQGNSEVIIRIRHAVSQHELTKFIENNFFEIYKLLKALPSEHGLTISARDFRIVELRDKEKMKFKDIANKIDKEYVSDKSMNEDQIKTAYRRSKEKIKSIVRAS
jgi:hypothetical protein